jgi:hypothetical protein
MDRKSLLQVSVGLTTDETKLAIQLIFALGGRH